MAITDDTRALVIASHDRYEKGAENLTERKRLIRELMKKDGNIQLNFDMALKTTYDVEMRDAPVQTLADGAAFDYNRNDYLDQASFTPRDMAASQMFTLREIELLRGSQGLIVDYFSRAFPKLDESLNKYLDKSFYQDGDAAANQGFFCGLETLLTAGTVTSADMIAAPADTYNGISTVFNAKGGTWSSNMTTPPNASLAVDWPFGYSMTPEADYWTPQLWNIKSSALTGATDMTTNIEPFLRRAISCLRVLNGDENAKMICVMENGMLQTLKDHWMADRRWVPPVDSEATDMGFSDVLMFEGCTIQASFGCPANTAYILFRPKLELLICTDKLFKRRGPIEEQRTGNELMAMYNFGNWRFWPKAIAKLYPYA